MEPPFANIMGVLSVFPGYTGGTEKNPSYSAVSRGQTHHLEAVQIEFDSSKIEYTHLLDIFWKQIDPTDATGQFADRGHHYSTAIFYHSDTQKQLAEQSKQQLTDSKRFKKDIVTVIRPACPFYKAEDYHHCYYKKEPIHYSLYKTHSGRQAFIDQIWKDV